MDTRIVRMECEKPQMQDIRVALRNPSEIMNIRLNVQAQYPKIRALLRPMFHCFVSSFGSHLSV